MIDKNSDQDEINHDSISTKGIEQTKNDENTKSKFKQKISTNSTKIEEIIGTGNEAKNSIIWITIRWCLAIPLTISILFFISLWASYYNNNYQEAKEIKEYMLKIWAVFAPLITLALGYLYGKNESIKESSTEKS
jgi:hypothetical protein